MLDCCLLDMDGVLVDFVGGACRHFGVASPYHDPKNLGQSRLYELLSLSKEELYAPLGEEFWANLEPTAECFVIVDMVQRHFGRDRVCILTSPISTHGCYEGKMRWLRRHLPQFSRRFLVGPVKEFAAGPHRWLVDDSDSNIDAFVHPDWGGRAVQVPRPWNRLHHLAGCVLPSMVRDLGYRGSISCV